MSENMCAEAMHAIPRRSACAQARGRGAGGVCEQQALQLCTQSRDGVRVRKARGQVMVMNAAQAAERAGVRPSTVSRWVQSGRLKAGRLPTGELQIEDGVLDEFLGPPDGLAAVGAGRHGRAGRRTGANPRARGARGVTPIVAR